MITEIEVEGVGIVRQCNDWQIHRIKRMRDKKNAHIAWMAFGAGMTVRQFKSLPADKQQAIARAFRALTSPANVPDFRPVQAPQSFQKGIHRSDEEKAEIGRQLIAKKAELPRGYFGPWLDEQGIPRGFAAAAMRLVG